MHSDHPSSYVAPVSSPHHSKLFASVFPITEQTSAPAAQLHYAVTISECVQSTIPKCHQLQQRAAPALFAALSFT